jgi:hypothetical protein
VEKRIGKKLDPMLCKERTLNDAYILKIEKGKEVEIASGPLRSQVLLRWLIMVVE